MTPKEELRAWIEEKVAALDEIPASMLKPLKPGAKYVSKLSALKHKKALKALKTGGKAAVRAAGA